MSTIALKLDGYTDLPKGKVAAIVTNLQMNAPPAWLAAFHMPPGFTVERLERPSIEHYRALYRAVGEDWLWFSRPVLSDAALAAIIHHPQVEVYVPRFEGEDIGLLELDFRSLPDCEITYFGLVPAMGGKGLGRALMAYALRAAWRAGVERVWIHTCTLDSAAGLALYRKVGFEPYLLQIEVADDPRLSGHVPMSAGPHVPVIA